MHVGTVATLGTVVLSEYCSHTLPLSIRSNSSATGWAVFRISSGVVISLRTFLDLLASPKWREPELASFAEN